MQACSSGKTISHAKIEFLRADGQGDRIKYYEVELENVLIASVNQTVHEGDVLHESLALKFSKVRWRYTQQRVAGGAAGNTSGGWDLASNRFA